MFFVIRCGKSRAKTSTHKFSDVDFHHQYKQLFYNHLSRNRIAFLLILGRKKFKAAQKMPPKEFPQALFWGHTLKPFSLSSPNQPPLIAQPAGRHLPKAFHLHLAFLP